MSHRILICFLYFSVYSTFDDTNFAFAHVTVIQRKRIFVLCCCGITLASWENYAVCHIPFLYVAFTFGMALCGKYRVLFANGKLDVIEDVDLKKTKALT